MTDKKASPEAPVVDYMMSLHYGICHGPLDSLNEVFIKEKLIESVDRTNPLTASTVFYINEPELFGGDKKEGGPKGTCEYYAGDLTQVMSSAIAGRVGLTPATMPGYRGIANIMFRGGGGSYSSPGTASFVLGANIPGSYMGAALGAVNPTYNGAGSGFRWTVNNPYLPGVWVNVTRSPKGLLPALALINNPQLDEDGEASFGDDANPAHIIYECLTNKDWGMDGGTAIIDTESFEYAAQALFDENFGLSLQWAKQATIEKFVSEILDHIQAALYQNPGTGKMEIKLFRDDYQAQIGTLPFFNRNNSRVIRFQRKGWGETINEIVVTWTNPENEKEETITYHDLANIAIQNGSIVSDTRNYYGVRNSDLAVKLAVRDSREASAPLATAEIEVDRRSWDVLPGQVVKVESPEDDIDEIIMRVGKVDYGKASDAMIKLTLTEDIFSLEQSEFITPPRTLWESTDQPPEVLDYTSIVTPPRGMLALAGLAPTPENDAASYPRVASLLMAQTDQPDTQGFDIIAPGTLSNGTTGIFSRGQMGLTSRATINTALTRETESTIPLDQMVNFQGVYGPDVGFFAFLGDDEDHELILFDVYDEVAETWNVFRGCLDTIPKEWPIGTSLWFVNPGLTAFDITEMSAFEVTPYQLRTRTSLGLLPLADTPTINFTASERPYLPSRPADVKVNGIAFDDVVQTAITPTTVTWVNRNRINEDTIIKKWDDGNVTPETGQTTTIRVRQTNGTLITEYTGITALTHDIPYEDYAGEEDAVIEVLAERDGFESHQFIAQNISVPPAAAPPARYWRILIDDNFASGGTADEYSTLSEVTLYDGALNDTTTTIGGTASASSQFSSGYAPARAFDRSLTTDWSTQVNQVPGSWIQWDFGAGNEQTIESVKIRSSNSGASALEAPKDFHIQNSDDGVTWANQLDVLGEPTWTSAEERTYTL